MVTIWDAVLTFGGGSNNVSFFAAISLTVVIYLVGYLLFFIGYLVLVFKKKDLKRTYEIPGGTVIKSIVAICGLIVSIFALLISFVPPSSLPTSSHHAYLYVLIISFVITVLLPFLIYEYYLKHEHHSISIPKHMLAKDINPTTPPIARGEHHIIANSDEKNIQ